MAIFLITYGFQDLNGTKQRAEVAVPRGTLTLAQIELFAQNLGALIDPITSAFITDINLNIGVDLPVGYKDTAAALSLVERGALFTFNADDTEYKTAVRIPAFVPTLFSGKSVNQAGPGVGEFIGAMNAGLAGGGATPQPSDKWENDILSLSKAVMSIRK